MVIESVHVQKFRSIDDSTIRFNQIIAIVGANNAGKSHFLRALNAFFNYADERDAFLRGDHIYSKQSRPKITVVFKEIIPEDEIPYEYIFNERLTIKFSFRRDRANPTYEVFLGTEKKNIDIESFHKLMKGFRYVYIPILRDYNTAFSPDNGIAYRLLSQIIKNQTSKRNTLQPYADRLINKVEGSIYTPAVKLIQQYYPFSQNREFKMQTKEADLIDLILRRVSLSLVEDTEQHSIDNCGSGIQSAVFLAISIAIFFEENTNYLVGIEEPEINMHPQAQRQLIEALKKRENYPRTQFVLSTHSTVIIDRLSHEDIVLCRKKHGTSRDVITMTKQISEDFWSKYNMNEEKYYDFFDFKNSDFFFSNYMIIMESTNDCRVVQKLLELHDVDTEALGISFVSADGERSIKYPYAISKELGIPFVCVVDRDVFQPYLNDDRKSSLDSKGIPKYKRMKKTTSPIYDLINEYDRDSIVQNIIDRKYKESLRLLEKYDITYMRYAIEVDLVICSSYCETFGEVLHLPLPNRNYTYILTERAKVIKDYKKINEVLERRGIKNLPESYRNVIRMISKMINEHK